MDTIALDCDHIVFFFSLLLFLQFFIITSATLFPIFFISFIDIVSFAQIIAITHKAKQVFIDIAIDERESERERERKKERGKERLQKAWV